LSADPEPGSPRRGSRVSLALALVLACVGPFFVYDHTREDTLSADEPVHVLSGLLMATRRDAIVNIEHPPLMKLLAGLSVARLDLAAAPERVPMGSSFWNWGHAYLFANRTPVDRIVAAARAPFLVLFGLLLLLVFAAARRRWGDGPAIFATALCAFDPNLVAHAGVVHTDLGAAITFLAAVLAFDAALREPRPLRLVLAAAALGAALLTKFSSVYLLPILLLQGLFAAFGSGEPGRAIRRAALVLVVACVGAFAAVFGVYAIITARMDPAAQRAVIHEMVALRGAPGLSAALERLSEVSPPLAHYLGGLASVFRQNAVGGGVNFLSGRIRVAEGFPQYFFVAFLAKSASGFLLLAAALLASLVRAGARAREEARLFLLPVLVLFLGSMGSSYNIGIRHLLPVYPFLALAGAGLLARVSPRRGLVLGFAFLPLVSAVELRRIHPHELSYFNPLVGGPERGRRILTDSNVDWGLELSRLAQELRRRGVKDPTVVYFGGDDVAYRVGVPDFLTAPDRRTAFVAVSAVQAAIGPALLAYHGAPESARARQELLSDLDRRGRRVGRVGYAFDLWELPDHSKGAAAAP
jgi:hypothetical protein